MGEVMAASLFFGVGWEQVGEDLDVVCFLSVSVPVLVQVEKAKEAAPAEETKEDAAPPPPPEEVVMRVFMHCVGCARKVKKILKGFDGNGDTSSLASLFVSCEALLCRCVLGAGFPTFQHEVGKLFVVSDAMLAYTFSLCFLWWLWFWFFFWVFFVPVFVLGKRDKM
jgi:hypothetical protein